LKTTRYTEVTDRQSDRQSDDSLFHNAMQ